MVLTGYALAGIIAWEIGIQSVWIDLPVVIIVYLFGQILQAFAMAWRKARNKNLFVVLKLSILLSILSLWDLVSIFLILPIVILSMIMGPFMMLLFFVTAVGLLIYGYENLIGDIKGYSSFENGFQATVALLAFLFSCSVLYFRFSEAGESFEDKCAGLVAELRDYLQSSAENTMTRKKKGEQT